MTNYEKIKSMSIKKMAKFLGGSLIACKICPNYNNCYCDCECALKEWLKAESEED